MSDKSISISDNCYKRSGPDAANPDGADVHPVGVSEDWRPI